MRPMEIAGREDLVRGNESRPTNYYDASPNLLDVLDVRASSARRLEMEGRLRAFGAVEQAALFYQLSHVGEGGAGWPSARPVSLGPWPVGVRRSWPVATSAAFARRASRGRCAARSS